MVFKNMFKRKGRSIKVKATKAKKIIDAEACCCFWLCSGQILKNLKELAESLEEMSDEIFNYHVNQTKNDFADWVGDVFKEKKLATDLKRAKTAKIAAKRVRARIK